MFFFCLLLSTNLQAHVHACIHTIFHRFWLANTVVNKTFPVQCGDLRKFGELQQMFAKFVDRLYACRCECKNEKN